MGFEHDSDGAVAHATTGHLPDDLHARLCLSGAATELHGILSAVAPYEADAQMAFLALNGHVHAVITEDSDLLPYGCPRVCSAFPLAAVQGQACSDPRAMQDPSTAKASIHRCLSWPERCCARRQARLCKPVGYSLSSCQHRGPALGTRRCLQVLFKLDKTGTGEEVCMRDMPNNQGLSFVGFTPHMFLEVRLCALLQIPPCCPSA